MYQYDFKKKKETEVIYQGQPLVKKETDKMRFYNRFSKEFGNDDVSTRQGDHSTDHVCSINFKDLMSKIYLSMIPYQLKMDAIMEIKQDTHLNKKSHNNLTDLTPTKLNST